MADPTPDPKLKAAYRDLKMVIRGSGHEKKVELIDVLNRMKTATLKLTLRERFSRLVQTLSSGDFERDVGAFEAISGLRNKLFHAEITQLPEEISGYKVEDTLRGLVINTFYLQ